MVDAMADALAEALGVVLVAATAEVFCFLAAASRFALSYWALE